MSDGGMPVLPAGRWSVVGLWRPAATAPFLAAPALDPAQAARARAGRRDLRADGPGGQLLHERLDEAHRFEDLVEAHRDTRRNVAAHVRSSARVELLVRRNRVIDAQIARDATRSGRKSGEAHPLGELGGNLSGHDEAVLRARVLVVDRFQGRDLALDSRQVGGEGFARGASQILRDAAGYDCIHEVAVAEELRVGPQQVFLQPPELEKTERQRDVVAEVTEVAEVVGDTLELEQD